MARAKKKTGRPRKTRKITLPRYGGDHGTGTAAALAGTVVEPITDEKGSNPNHMARRVRQSVIKGLSLTMRQGQAAEAIQDAYCRNQMLSSGSPLREQVDASPKPDATIAAQMEAQSRLIWVMKAVNHADRPVIEHICWYNLPLRALPSRKRCGVRLRDALDAVADHLNY